MYINRGENSMGAIPILQRAFETNSTATSITLGVPSATEPTGTGVFNLSGMGPRTFGENRGNLLIKPFGSDDADDEFRLIVEGYHLFRTQGTSGVIQNLYIPTTLAVLDCTMGISVPADAIGSPEMLAATDRFAENVVMATGTSVSESSLARVSSMAATSGDVVTGASGVAILDTIGCSYIKFHVDVNGGGGTGAASGNCLFATI